MISRMDMTKYYIKSKMPKFIYPIFILYKYNKWMGKSCNLKNPVTYSEKTQWCKLHRNNREIGKYVDKIKVREYVASTVGEQYLIPIIGEKYKSEKEIDFDKLPKQFVIKANHGSGFNYIVKDKTNLDVEKVKNVLHQWLNIDYSFFALEQQYKYIEPQLYIEQYLMVDGMTDLPDYKFFCFNGKVFCSYTMVDYAIRHEDGRLSFFDRDYKIMPYYRKDYAPINEQLEQPINYETMVEIAEKLSKGFSHVRVDLYNLNGKIYFGEMTFTTNGGYCLFEPDEFDKILGNQWDLTKGI